MSDDVQRPEPEMARGVPTDMRATCTNCGQTYRGGTVTVWLKRADSRILNEARDDVSFLCTKGCDEVHDMEVEILARRE